MISKKITLLFVTLLLISCHTSKQMAHSPEKTDNATLEELMDQISEAQKFKTYSAKGTVSYTGADSGGDADAQLKVIYDSAALLIIRKYGIELFRLLLDKDSVTSLDRIDNSWSKNSISEWAKSYKVPLDYLMIQDIVTSGFYLTEYLSYQLEKNSEGYSVKGFSELFTMTTDLTYSPPKPLKMSLRQDRRLLDIGFNEITTFSGRVCPKSLEAVYKDEVLGTTDKIIIKWKEISIDKEVSIKFAIPDHYTRK